MGRERGEVVIQGAKNSTLASSCLVTTQFEIGTRNFITTSDAEDAVRSGRLAQRSSEFSPLGKGRPGSADNRFPSDDREYGVGDREREGDRDRDRKIDRERGRGQR
ncbi:hypothetical protein ElyMa_005733000 [Elysia marginata]|uniref:Uncharacterized protein n=1 Tax=Elysia marginata TaxID=1093978 RepID=A0AAV4FJV0_9GAST|nr:hypothetical protein ElyMa_005733000 [Elysia marginata]